MIIRKRIVVHICRTSDRIRSADSAFYSISYRARIGSTVSTRSVRCLVARRRLRQLIWGEREGERGEGEGEITDIGPIATRIDVCITYTGCSVIDAPRAENRSLLQGNISI